MSTSRGSWILTLCLLGGVVGYTVFARATASEPVSQPSETVSVSATPPPAPLPSLSASSSDSATPTASSSGPRTSPAVPGGSDTSSLSAAERRDVTTFAETFMKALAKPPKGVTARQWWSTVASMLTDDAVDVYAGISPAVIPFRHVTGPIVIEAIDPDSDAFWVQPVTIGTDAGTYRLLVQLKSAGFADRLQVIEIQEP